MTTRHRAVPGVDRSFNCPVYSTTCRQVGARPSGSTSQRKTSIRARMTAIAPARPRCSEKDRPGMAGA